MLIDDYISKSKIEIISVTGENMTDEEYFSTPGISNSKLRLLNPKEGGSPAKYQAGFPQTFNPSFLLGSAIHSQILNPNDIKVSLYENKPSGKLGYFIEKLRDFRKMGNSIAKSIELASDYTDYYKGKLTKKRFEKAFKEGIDYYIKLYQNYFFDPTKEQTLVLPKAQLDICWECVKSLRDVPRIRELRAQNIPENKEEYNEYAFFAKFVVTLPDKTKIPLNLKGKADNFIIDPEKREVHLNDVKTTSRLLCMFMDKIDHNNQTQIDGVFSHHHYYTQLALYNLFLEKYLETKNPEYKNYDYYANIWAVETVGEHKADCFPINKSYIELGNKELKELLVRVAFHETYGWDKDFEQSI